MTRIRDDLVWIAPPVAAGVVCYLLYLETNPYPAHGAGLYLSMAEAVRGHGYALPRTIPHYTRGGVPFAYPPLAIYGLALVRDATGVGPLVLTRLLPGPLVIASLLPTYYLARELLGSRPGAAVATTLVAINPQLIDWHLTAGGVVRTPAYVFTVTGLYAALRLVRSPARDRRWLGLAVVGFLATLLTHPTYSLFFVVSYLVWFAVVDRTWAGFLDGAIVGVGGVALAAPWWSTVARAHGIDVFLGAMGSHGGIGGGLVARAASAALGPVELLLGAVLVLLVVAGLATGWPVLAAWLVGVALVMSQPRFTLLVATFLGVGVVRSLAPRLRSAARPSFDPARLVRSGPALVFSFALVVATLSSAGYVRDDTAAPRHTATPDHVDEADLEAMQWAREETATDASFVVLGDAAEWFPLFAERTLLVSPWGAEWEGSQVHARHVRIHWQVSTCETVRCLRTTLDLAGVRPEYVYVPRGRYPILGTPHRRSGALASDLERSDRYVQVFRNEGVTVFRRAGTAGGDGGTAGGDGGTAGGDEDPIGARTWPPIPAERLPYPTE